MKTLITEMKALMGDGDFEESLRRIKSGTLTMADDPMQARKMAQNASVWAAFREMLTSMGAKYRIATEPFGFAFRWDGDPVGPTKISIDGLPERNFRVLDIGDGVWFILVRKRGETDPLPVSITPTAAREIRKQFKIEAKKHQRGSR